MKKSEIIAKIMEEVRHTEDDNVPWNGNEASYHAYVAKALPLRLRDISPEVDVVTCEDLRHLGIECCPVCHNEFPDEQQLAELELGAIAWLRCSLIRARRAKVLNLK